MPSPRNSDHPPRISLGASRITLGAGRVYARPTLPVLMVIVTIFCFGAASAGAAPGPFLQPGQAAPHAVLQDLSGLDCPFPVPGKWNLVFFWSLFCQVCLEELPLVVQELRNLPDNPCESFFVSLDTVKMKKGLTNFITKRKLDCRLLLEEIASGSYLSADAWGVRTTPATFLIDPDGRIVLAREGPFPLEELFQLLKELPPASSPLNTCAGSGSTPIPEKGEPKNP